MAIASTSTSTWARTPPRSSGRRHRPRSIAAPRAAPAASQRLAARVAPGAALTVVPDPIVCFAEARYDQEVVIDLAPSASLWLIDGYSCGRSARGERWAFARYASRTTITRGGARFVVDATRLDPGHGPLADRMGRFDIVFSLLAVGPRFAAAREAMLGAHAESRDDSVLMAASPLGGRRLHPSRSCRTFRIRVARFAFEFRGPGSRPGRRPLRSKVVKAGGRCVSGLALGCTSRLAISTSSFSMGRGCRAEAPGPRPAPQLPRVGRPHRHADPRAHPRRPLGGRADGRRPPHPRARPRHGWRRRDDRRSAGGGDLSRRDEARHGPQADRRRPRGPRARAPWQLLARSRGPPSFRTWDRRRRRLPRGPGRPRLDRAQRRTRRHRDDRQERRRPAHPGRQPLSVRRDEHRARLDRARAQGRRLDIPAGTAVRFEPGDEKTVRLVATATTGGAP